MLKYAMEILLSESSVITNHYFKWNTSAVAIFLAILGLTVLPINAVVGTYISNMFEDRFVNLIVSSPCYFCVTIGPLESHRIKGFLPLFQEKLQIWTSLPKSLCSDRQLLMASQITLLVGIIFSFKVTSTYSVIQYVISALITFVSAEVLEGKNFILNS